MHFVMYNIKKHNYTKIIEENLTALGNDYC